MSSNKAFGRGTWGNGLIGRLRGRYYDGALYNNWLGPTTNIGDKGPIQRGRSLFGRIGSGIQGARLGARNARQSRLGAAFLGSENRKGFQGSATGTMGTMLGLGMLANYASPEAQGFLSAGSMVGMMNPLAGLAIGLGGTALTAKTAGGGALAGAGAGAAIGTMIAPGVGTVVGTVIGTVVGTTMGIINKAKDEKKKVREAMESLMNDVIVDNLKSMQVKMLDQGFVGKSAILSEAGAMSSDLKRVTDFMGQFGPGQSKEMVQAMFDNQKQLGISMSNEELETMLKRPEEASKMAAKHADKTDALNKMNKIYGNRLKELTSLTGKSEMEIEKMAMEMGVNLYDATADFNEILKKLGITTEMTREQMRGLQMDMAIKGLSVFDEKIKELDTPEVLDEQARAFRDMYDAAIDNKDTLSDKDLMTFFKDMMPNFLNFAGGGLQGALQAKKLFGKGGTEFKRKEMINGVEVTSPFFGMEDLFNKGAAGNAVQGYIDSTIATGSTQLGGNLNSMLYNAGGGKFQVDSKLFGTALQNMDADTAGMLVSAIQDGTLFADYNMENLTQQNIMDALSKFGVDPASIGLRASKTGDDLQISLDEMPDELRKTYEGIITLFQNFFDSRDSTVPEWMTNEFIKARAAELPPDTFSSRGKGIGDTVTSRLSQTMGRHSQMDGMITGKRTVTSAWRNFALGSPSSDHVMGRAYDLTGQNLGGYARLVRTGGGFAEFHGSNAGRHLHVVPGPGPYGDVVAPKPIGITPVSTGSGSTVINLTQNIQAGPNATPEAIAKMAVTHFKMMLDNERQRA